MNEQAREAERRRVRAGFLISGAIVLSAAVIFFLDTIERVTSEGPRITVTADAAPGIQPGSTVWVAGRPVGRVTRIRFRPPGPRTNNVLISGVLQRGVDDVLRADASVRIQAASLLAPAVIAIDPGSPGAGQWSPDDTLRTESGPLDPDVLLEMARPLQDAAAELGEEARRLRDVVRRGDGTALRLAANPDVLDEARASLRLVDDSVAARYPQSTLGRFARDTVITGRLERIAERLARLDTLPGRRRARLGFERTADALDAFRARLAGLFDRLDAGEGTAGRALRDGEIRRQLALLRARLDSAVVELAGRPDRWLKVRIF